MKTDRQTERVNQQHFAGFLQLPNVTRIYINELTPSESNSLPVQLLKLITEPEATAPELAIELARQAQAEIPDISTNLINLLETIILYKLPQKSREEIAAMFSLSDLKQTRVYQEIFEEVQAAAKQRERLAIFRMVDLGLTTEKIATVLDLPVAEVEATIAATAASIAAATTATPATTTSIAQPDPEQN